MANRKTTSSGPLAALKKMFSSAPAAPLAQLPISSGHNVVSRSGLSFLTGNRQDAPGELTTQADQIGINLELPLERLSRYTVLEEMAKSATVSQALNIHLAQALSPSKRTGLAFSIVAKDPGDKETVARCNELMNDLGEMIDTGLPSWGLLMAIFGVGYMRPYGEPGRGIVNIESSYYTLPYFIQEFNKGGTLAGFSGDYLLSPETMQRMLADPWEIVAMKNPFWTPSGKIIPVTTGTRGYSLLTEQNQHPITETQNYGTSFLENSYETFMNLCGALNALKATRYNAAKIDRLIALTTGTLDPVNAANYTRTVSQSLKRNSEAMSRRSLQANTMPTVLNHLIPVMGDGKNNITIDTQYIPADITGIEDVMFHLRQLCSSLGIDSTMLGWADQMSGGLGEGGWAQTAIQAAIRAQWLRQAASDVIYRLTDIHLAYKHGKAYLSNQRPYSVQFNSMNTALMQEEARDQDSRANFIAVITQILDQIQQSPKLAGSETFMRYLFCDQLKMDEQMLQSMIKEFNATKDAGEHDDMMYESAPGRGDDSNPETWSREQLLNFAKFVMTQQ
ncbi:TPA: phage portal protein [Citrobacter freundii]|nr:phage portal protein [Citrobacter freundii]